MSGRPAPAAVLPLMLAATAAALCGGCASPADDAPRDRLGALPFPGLLTLYTAADPGRLGPHRYEAWPRLFRADETERGIIYTTRAGFLDLAHVRIAIDWTRFCTRGVRDALAAGRESLVLTGPDGGAFHVTLAYPAGGSGFAADEAADRIGQRVAYLMMTWHEVATWFGHRAVFFVDESPSAFTYDDSVAHLVGMRVAERAMRDSARAFDEAVTAALDAELRRLGAVGPDQTDQAARAVEGRWWAAGRPLKRQADVCPGDDVVVYPWLVPNLPFGDPNPVPEPFPLPRLDGLDAPRASVRATVAIDPRIAEAGPMRGLVPGRPEWFRDDSDLPALLRAMRAQMRSQYGPSVEQP